MAAAAFDPAAVDWEDPAPFYLGDPGLAELADVTIKHSGLALPAHSQLLAVQSSVLRDLFRSLPAEPGGKKRKRGEKEALELETPFTSHTLQEVAFLLHFCYVFTDAAPSQLDAVSAHLPGIARLAHSLNIPTLLAAIDAFAAGRITDQQAALAWLPLAETCQLEATWAQGIRTLAKHVVSGSVCSLNPLLDGEGMEHLGQKTLASALTALAAALRTSSDACKEEVDGKLPSAAELRSWQSPGVQRASYTWRIPDFMQQRGRLVSPEFGSGQAACSRKLRLAVHPHGQAGSAGHVSIFLTSDFVKGGPSMLTNFTVKLVDQTWRPRRTATWWAAPRCSRWM
ncbi:hypothetical protein ABPG75_013215 [Micractinium tetrahymenae]